MVLVANSEFELNLGEPRTQSSWIINEKGLEKLAIDRWVKLLGTYYLPPTVAPVCSVLCIPVSRIQDSDPNPVGTETICRILIQIGKYRYRTK